MIEQLINYRNEKVIPDVSNLRFTKISTPNRYALHSTLVKYKTQLLWVGGSVTGVGERWFDYLDGTSWKPMPLLLPEARMCHNTVVVGDKLYLWGGQILNTLATKMYSYDFITNSWEDLGVIPSTCAFSDCCVIGNKIYYFGGMITSVSDNSPAKFLSYEYDITTRIWRDLNIGLSGRMNPGVAVSDEKIFILGGRRNLNHIKELWCYDPVTEMLTAKTPPPQAVNGRCQFVNYKGWLILAFGGLTSGDQANPICYRYHPVQDKWEQWAPNDSLKRVYAGCAVYGDSIYLFGGFNGSAGLSDGVLIQP